MSLLWCCCELPGGFTLAGITVSASVYLVKQNDMKAAHLTRLKRKMFAQKSAMVLLAHLHCK